MQFYLSIHLSVIYLQFPVFNPSNLHFFLPHKVEKVLSVVVVLSLISHVRFIMLEVQIVTGLGVLLLTVLFH